MTDGFSDLPMDPDAFIEALMSASPDERHRFLIALRDACIEHDVDWPDFRE